MTEPSIINKRNECGVKNSCDQYRVFAGEHYVCWLFGHGVEETAARVKEYRAAGLRCRRIGDDLYLHHEDGDKARAIDVAAGHSHCWL